MLVLAALWPPTIHGRLEATRFNRMLPAFMVLIPMLVVIHAFCYIGPGMAVGFTGHAGGSECAHYS